MELWLIKQDTMTNITPLIGSLSWRSNIQELGDQLTFNVAFNDARYFPKNPVDIGNLLSLKGSSEIFRGIVTTENKTGRSPITYTAFDYAFYLNKSKGIYQFNGITASDAITKLCNDFSVPIGNVEQMITVIDKIYVQDTISDIIRDILKQVENATGQKYLMEMRSGKFYIEKQTNLIIKGSFQLAANLAPNDVTHAISEPSHTRSIEEMKNSIQIIKDNKLVGHVKNDNLIDFYGLLQEVITVDKNIAEATNIANNMLKELGRIFEESSLQMLGDENVRAGRLIEINEPITGIIGTYLINDAEHTFENGIHKMNVSLGVV